MSMQIHCSPGNLVACWAQKWNCAPELIEELFGIDRYGGITIADREATYQRILKGIRRLKARGYKRAEYCQGCGHKIMEFELRARHAQA